MPLAHMPICPYAQGAGIVFLFVGVLLMIGGAKSKDQREQTFR
jgi:hypothetical protein